MPQIDIEQMKKHASELIEKAKELKKTASELYETIKDSELRREVEKLAEINETLSYFILENASEFALHLHDPVGEEIGVLVQRLSFTQVIYVPRNTNIIDIYVKFFSDKKILEKLVSDLVTAIINVARSVEKNADLFAKVSELESEIKFISEKLDEIEKKLEDP